MSEGNGRAKSANGGQIAEVVRGMNWPTVALILASGGTNWLATNNNSQSNRYEIERARDQINQMFLKQDDFENRQLAMIDAAKQIAGDNHQQLENQSALLKRNDKALEQLSIILKRLDGDRVRRNQAPEDL